jgi:hypothetical protein
VIVSPRVVMSAWITQQRGMTVARQAFSTENRLAEDVWSSVASPKHKPGWVGCAVSGAVHLALVGIAALIGLPLPGEGDKPMLDSLWSAEEGPAEIVAGPALIGESAAIDPGGETIQSITTLLTDEPPRAPTAERPWQPSLSPWALPAAHWTVADVLTAAGAPQVARSQGKGRGEGLGDGQGFFGLSPRRGRKIVYVVDNSRSMNHPHDSEAKTRFRRVKVELINSIWHMGPEQAFYIIFFSNKTHPMPATTLQAATPAAKQRYLEWAARMDAGGAPTDPRQALELALNLKPDIIYFLTDGEFDKSVNRKLTRIKQSRTAIHTFAFGERIGEAVLEKIARNNQGQYMYIP